MFNRDQSMINCYIVIVIQPVQLLLLTFLMEIVYNDDEKYKEIVPLLLHAYAAEPTNTESIVTPPQQPPSLFSEVGGEDMYKKNKQKRKPNIELKNLIQRSKVQKLKYNFIRKIKRTQVPFLVPHQVLKKQISQQSQHYSLISRFKHLLQNYSGVYISVEIQAIFSFIKLLDIIMMIFVYSIMLGFPQSRENQDFFWFRIISLGLQVCFIGISLFIIKYDQGKEIKNLKEIMQNYVKNEITSDLLGLMAMVLAITLQTQSPNVIIVLILLSVKLKSCVKETQKFQYIYIGSTQKQRYFGLIKILILNFSIGHILSITLNLMSYLNSSMNWVIKLGITNEYWLVKYIWGYYWGTNIMLTVGFGDISASNYQEALALIFIQTFSCITLAYNISQVGSIIGEMKADSEEKNKKLKYIHKMCKENDLSYDFQNKVVNFIEQSYQIKEAFQFDEYEEVLNSLPKAMQAQYRIESNRSLFDIPFFNILSHKTLACLAENVVRRITHPDETILKKGSPSNFSILQRGKIGFLCRKGKSLLNGYLVQKFQVKQHGRPTIVSLDFIKRKPLTFDIKSLSYSIIYYLQNQEFMKCFKNCELDYQLLCTMRDKDQFFIDSNEIYKCEACTNEFHSKFNCPKYHYIPLKQHVIAARLEKQKTLKQPRALEDRRDSNYKYNKALFIIDPLRFHQEQFILDHYGLDELRDLKKMREYYNIKNGKQQEDSGHKVMHSIFTGIINTSGYGYHSEFTDLQIKKFEQLLEKQKSPTHDFWLVETDEANNYKYYFHDSNPDRLSNRRLKKLTSLFFE